MDKHLANIPKEKVAEIVGREIASKISDEVVGKLTSAVTSRVLDHIEKSAATPAIAFEKYTTQKYSIIDTFVQGNLKMQEVVNEMDKCQHDQERVTRLIGCMQELLTLNRLHYDFVLHMHE